MNDVEDPVEVEEAVLLGKQLRKAGKSKDALVKLLKVFVFNRSMAVPPSRRRSAKATVWQMHRKRSALAHPRSTWCQLRTRR